MLQTFVRVGSARVPGARPATWPGLGSAGSQATGSQAGAATEGGMQAGGHVSGGQGGRPPRYVEFLLCVYDI